MKKDNGLKKFRVHFRIDTDSYRDVMAFDEDDAMEQVQGDFLCSDDFERANPCNADVDYVDELKPVKKKKVSK